MWNRKTRRIGLGLVVIAITASLVSAQMTITGSIAGTVVDPTAQMVAGAKITLTSTTTGDVRTAEANEVGAFNIPAVQPGAYSLRIQLRLQNLRTKRSGGQRQ